MKRSVQKTTRAAAKKNRRKKEWKFEFWTLWHQFVMSFPSVLAAVWAVGWAEKTNWNSRRLEIVKSSQLFWSFLSRHSLLQLLTSRHAGWRAVRNGERSWHGDGRVSHIKDVLWRSWQQPADWQCVRQSAELQSHVGSVWTLSVDVLTRQSLFCVDSCCDDWLRSCCCALLVCSTHFYTDEFKINIFAMKSSVSFILFTFTWRRLRGVYPEGDQRDQ